MRILLVEDEDRSARQTKRKIAQIIGAADIVTCINLEEANAAAESSLYDLLICDLRIPSGPNRLDHSEDHGRAAYAHARNIHPGLPTIFLSANATPQNSGRETSSGGIAPAFGIEAFPMARVAVKGTSDLEDRLREIAEGLRALEGFPIANGSGEPVEELFARAAKMYGVSHGALSATVSMTSGLSGSRVGIVTYATPPYPPASVVLKVDTIERTDREAERFNRFVNNRLPAGHFASQFRIIRTGLRDQGAAFSTVAARTQETLYRRLDHDASYDPVPSLISTTEPWDAVVELSDMTVGQVRERSIGLHRFEELPNFSGEMLEADLVKVPISWKIAHGDLHGENLLIDPSNVPILIDFADTDVYPASYDPVALELSLLAHPKAPELTAWPTDEQLESWGDLDTYVIGSPFPELVRNCRSWAISLSSPEQVLAVAHAQSAWLMKHSGIGAARAAKVALSTSRALKRLAD